MFTWKDFFDFSKKIREEAVTQKTPPEQFTDAMFRTATSRAYYSAFHQVKRFAEIKLGYTFPHFPNSNDPRSSRHGSHKDLIEFLFLQSDQNVRDIGDKLNDCKAARVKCDYDALVLKCDKVSEIAEIKVGEILSAI